MDGYEDHVGASAEPGIDPPSDAVPPRPSSVVSAHSFDSPQRHRHRNPRARRPVKETLNARSEYTTSQDDGTAEHHINQYVIRQEIGRGSFGAVHLAADQFGNEYAVKEFSKSRLRKRAQSHLLRRPRGPSRPGTGFNSPLHRYSEDDRDRAENSLDLIKQEIAIMKKLNHSNLVSLIEVLDDPTEDSLYMVMEMCKKGVIMKVGLEERADPYDDEHCLCWFRDLILGIEYLHAQGIVHRDIKPDNCLVTNDDVLKVVDFGVSEMFEKDSDMFTAKSAGSPAFFPPELCVVKHGDVSGKAADIWSMGVTLYCLRYGRLPFEKQSIFELYESIRKDPVVCEDETDESFKDLINRILEKDPASRIKMRDIREHPWVTKNGDHPLLSWEENTAQIVEPPTEEEIGSAITRNMGHLLTVMKAVKNFRRLVDPSKPGQTIHSILGGEYEPHFVEPPLEMDPDEEFPAVGIDPESHQGHGLTAEVRKGLTRPPILSGLLHRHDDQADRLLVSSDSTSLSSRPEISPASSQRPSGVLEPERKDSGSICSGRSQGKPWEDLPERKSQSASPQLPLSRVSSATTKRSVEGTRGHARDPLEEEFPYLFIGPSTYTGSSGLRLDETRKGGDSAKWIPDEPESAMDSPDEPSNSDEPVPIVSESPGAAEFDIYETAYSQELERIKSSLTDRHAGPKVYLTRRVEGRDEVMKLAKEKALDLQIGEMFTFPPALRGASAFRSAAGVLRNQIAMKRQLEASKTADAEQTDSAASSPSRSHGDRTSSPAREHDQCAPPPPPSSSSHPPPTSALSSQSLPRPKPSSLEGTGTSATDTGGGEDSKAHLRRLLGRVTGNEEDSAERSEH